MDGLGRRSAVKFVGKLIAITLAVLMVWALVSAWKGPRAVSATCGPTVTQGPMTAGLNVGASIGDRIHDLIEGGPTYWEVFVTVRDAMRLLRTFKDTFGAHVRDEPEPSAATGIRVATREAQQKALDSCCPKTTPPDDPNIPGTPPGGGGGYPPGEDPRAFVNVSDQNATRLTGAALAADAMKAAGFPKSEIRMGVTVAKYESGFRWGITGPTVKGSGTMRGGWQIADGVHDVNEFGDWRDPYVNARLAYKVWNDAGGSWSPWSTASKARANLLQAIPGVPRSGDGNTDSPEDRKLKESPTYCSGRPSDVPAGETQTISADFSELKNPKSSSQAVTMLLRYAEDQTPIMPDACLHYIGLAYGHPGTTSINGRHWAIDQWTYGDPKLKHPGDRAPPRGALLFWNTGPGRAGHIAVALGDGRVVSTDVPVDGRIGIKPLSFFDSWGKYQGWMAPDFYGQTVVGQAA